MATSWRVLVAIVVVHQYSVRSSIATYGPMTTALGGFVRLVERSWYCDDKHPKVLRGKLGFAVFLKVKHGVLG